MQSKDLDTLDYSQSQTNYYFNGKSDNLPEIGKDVCARLVVTSLKDGNPQHFVKMDGGEFFDPSNISVRYKRKPWKFRKVGVLAFQLYLSFLGHPTTANLGKQSLKIKAEREQ